MTGRHRTPDGARSDMQRSGATPTPDYRPRHSAEPTPRLGTFFYGAHIARRRKAKP